MIHRTKQGWLLKTDSPVFFGVLGVIVATGVNLLWQASGPQRAVADEPVRSTSLADRGLGPVVEHYGPGVSYEEYCKQVALACLINSIHEIDDSEVRFMRDPTRPGSAVQQFSSVFGAAIAYRSAPDLLTGTKQESFLRDSGFTTRHHLNERSQQHAPSTGRTNP